MVAGAGAREAVVHVDRLAELDEDGTRERHASAPSAPRRHVRALWRQLEEFNLSPQLALEALFVRLRRELATG